MNKLREWFMRNWKQIWAFSLGWSVTSLLLLPAPKPDVVHVGISIVNDDYYQQGVGEVVRISFDGRVYEVEAVPGAFDHQVSIPAKPGLHQVQIESIRRPDLGSIYRDDCSLGESGGSIMLRPGDAASCPILLGGPVF